MLICIDAGHGGSDPGTVSAEITEKEITLALAQKLSAQLERCGVGSIQTRTGDEDVTLASRCQTANSNQADLFVSIHVNSNAGTPATGIETWIYRNTTISRPFAQAVHDSIIAEVGAVNRGIKESGFYVLSGTNMPAILIETGFINNDADREILTDENYQDQLAGAIAKGICSYTGIAYNDGESVVPPLAVTPVPAPIANEPIPGYGSDPAAFIYAISAASLETDKIKALQIALTLDGSPVTVDGILGTQTEAALKKHTLRIGSRGHLVVYVQKLLGADIDAVYGPKTAARVKTWQAREGKAADSIVGVKTYRGLALDSE